jgi:hypothetical protein
MTQVPEMKAVILSAHGALAIVQLLELSRADAVTFELLGLLNIVRGAVTAALEPSADVPPSSSTMRAQHKRRCALSAPFPLSWRSQPRSTRPTCASRPRTSSTACATARA